MAGQINTFSIERGGMEFMVFDKAGFDAIFVINLTKEKLEVELLKAKLEQIHNEKESNDEKH